VGGKQPDTRDLIEQLDESRRSLPRWDMEHEIFVCRGYNKGCSGPHGGPCGDCYVIYVDDSRSSEHVIRDMERGNA
jgi:hypothetical protein